MPIAAIHNEQQTVALRTDLSLEETTNSVRVAHIQSYTHESACVALGKLVHMSSDRRDKTFCIDYHIEQKLFVG